VGDHGFDDGFSARREFLPIPEGQERSDGPEAHSGLPPGTPARERSWMPTLYTRAGSEQPR